MLNLQCVGPPVEIFNRQSQNKTGALGRDKARNISLGVVNKWKEMMNVSHGWDCLGEMTRLRENISLNREPWIISTFKKWGEKEEPTTETT